MTDNNQNETLNPIILLFSSVPSPPPTLLLFYFNEKLIPKEKEN